MLQVVYDKSGNVKLEDVPKPAVGKNQVLVKTSFSVISSGTEKSMLGLMKKPLYKMALERRDLTEKVIKFAKDQGIKKTMDLVKSRLDLWHLLGYSCSGEIVAVGEGVTEFSKGDKVACCGSGFANHAEYVSVPQTLVAKIPKDVSLEEGSFGGVGAIAMQSVRRLEPTIGESIVVIGLGLLGQIVAQILKANGCKVIGVDVDPRKVKKDYIDVGITASSVKQVIKHTKGLGADGVIIAAATKANLVNDAFDMCRKRGRVVLLGVCDLTLDRAKMYEKELDFRMSTSFGPGYYDEQYEKKGNNYPQPYVPWTAQGNMDAILYLISTGKLSVKGLIERTFAIEKAQEAYDLVVSKSPLAVLLKYSSKKEAKSKIEVVSQEPVKGTVRVGFIGAGNFVKGFLLPEFSKKKDFSINAICTATGTVSKKVAEDYKAQYATTDSNDILKDKKVDLVVIGTRHDSHAQLATDALKAGKHVYVEKPAAIAEKEFEVLKKAVKGSKKRFVVGFNRRYSPVITKLKERLASEPGPIMINYVFNNSFLPSDHWVNQPDVGGGRIIGEACHIVDLFGFLTDSTPVEVNASQVSATEGEVNEENNVAAVIKYANGSVCTLLYSCIGNHNVDKEKMTVMKAGNVFEMNNFTDLTQNGKKLMSVKQEYGYSEQIEELRKALKGEDNNLITSEEGLQATETTFEMVRQIKN